MDASKFQSHLPPTSFGHLRECCFAFEAKEYFASAIWGAVFLEAFLGDLITDLDIGDSGSNDLNNRIQQLQRYANSHGRQKPDIPDEVVKRCHEVRNTRNRLVHHTGLTKTTLAQDAQYIVAGLNVILEWYREFQGDVPTGEAGGTKPGDEAESGIRIFMSTITPHSQRQQYFLESLFGKLREIGVCPVRLVPDIFHKTDPIYFVRQKIESCQAVIVLGLERSHAYFLRDKEGSESEAEEMHRRYTSGWLHLEAGLANALGLPVFVACEKTLCGDGIFDRSWNSYPVTELSNLDPDSPELLHFLNYVRQWVDQQNEAAATEKNK